MVREQLEKCDRFPLMRIYAMGRRLIILSRFLSTFYRLDGSKKAYAFAVRSEHPRSSTRFRFHH